MTDQNPPPQKVLVIGAYGLLGFGITKHLLADGHQVTGLGRSAEMARRVLPDVPWIEGDMRSLCDEHAWHAILGDVSAVVNCSGALQDGPQDDLEAVHHHAVAALAKACAAQDVALVQLSAVGAAPDASTQFLASKGRSDQAIAQAGGTHQIFRPGLVLAQNAYGGTALLRMLTAVPWLQPIATPQAKIQTASLDYVAQVVAAAVNGQIPSGFQADLVEEQPQSLRVLVAEIRRWLGFPAARMELVLPPLGTRLVAKTADLLSHLGWRSPLRSTAINVLSDGVLGTHTDLTPFGLPKPTPLPDTMARIHVGAQDRLAARMALLFPLLITCLSLFWLASGIIGVIRINTAAQVLTDVGWPSGLARFSVLFWAIVDIAIGVAFAFKKHARRACWAAIGVSLFYLFASSLTVPSLWLDPLGPLVKVVPGIFLALVTRAALETR